MEKLLSIIVSILIKIEDNAHIIKRVVASFFLGFIIIGFYNNRFIFAEKSTVNVDIREVFSEINEDTTIKDLDMIAKNHDVKLNKIIGQNKYRIYKINNMNIKEAISSGGYVQADFDDNDSLQQVIFFDEEKFYLGYWSREETDNIPEGYSIRDLTVQKPLSEGKASNRKYMPVDSSEDIIHYTPSNDGKPLLDFFIDIANNPDYEYFNEEVLKRGYYVIPDRNPYHVYVCSYENVDDLDNFILLRLNKKYSDLITIESMEFHDKQAEYFGYNKNMTVIIQRADQIYYRIDSKMFYKLEDMVNEYYKNVK